MSQLAELMQERERLARELDNQIAEAGRAYARYSELNSSASRAIVDAGYVPDDVISSRVDRAVLDVCLTRAGLRSKAGETVSETVSDLVARQHRHHAFTIV
jgi:hypothetical protein